MLQSLPFIIFLAIIFLFGFENLHQARVNFPFAGSFEIRTIFLLIICFFLGYAAATFSWMKKYMKDRTKHGQ